MTLSYTNHSQILESIQSLQPEVSSPPQGDCCTSVWPQTATLHLEDQESGQNETKRTKRGLDLTSCISMVILFKLPTSSHRIASQRHVVWTWECEKVSDFVKYKYTAFRGILILSVHRDGLARGAGD